MSKDILYFVSISPRAAVANTEQVKAVERENPVEDGDGKHDVVHPEAGREGACNLLTAREHKEHERIVHKPQRHEDRQREGEHRCTQRRREERETTRERCREIGV